MLIRRNGSSRNMGIHEISLDNQSFSLGSDGSVLISSFSVKDFNADARHDYNIIISPEEVRKITSFALRSAKFAGV